MAWACVTWASCWMAILYFAEEVDGACCRRGGDPDVEAHDSQSRILASDCLEEGKYTKSQLIQHWP